MDTEVALQCDGVLGVAVFVDNKDTVQKGQGEVAEVVVGVDTFQDHACGRVNLHYTSEVLMNND